MVNNFTFALAKKSFSGILAPTNLDKGKSIVEARPGVRGLRPGSGGEWRA